MIKTLRITTIIAAFLAVGFLAFPVVYGYRYHGVEEIEQFLSSPGAVESFKKAKGAKRVKGGDQVSPLLKQAMGFGLYLNPPRRAAAPKPTRKPGIRKPAPITEAPVVFSTKFTLIGTSYYASRPDLSLAYIDEPGKGLHWVRQGDKVSHLLIQEVQDGSVIVKDRDKLNTLVVARAPKKSLLRSDKTSKSTTVMPGTSTSITSSVSAPVGSQRGGPPTLPRTDAAKRAIAAKSAAMAATPPRVTVPRPGRRPMQPSEAEQDAVLAEFINELKAMEGTGKNGSEYSAEERAALKEAIVDFEAMRITAGEAKRLDRLGRELGNVQSDPERAKKLKIQSSAGKQQLPKSSPPRTSPPPPRRPQPPRRPPRK
jgi:hypothetical protein